MYSLVKLNYFQVIREFQRNKWNVQACEYAPNGIRFLQRPQGNLFAMQEFKQGYFEVQDEAS